MISRREILFTIPVVMAVPRAVFATTYFSLEAVQKTLFPSASNFVPVSATLTPAQMTQISKMSNTRVRTAKIALWKAIGPLGTLGTLIVDQVYGKHEFITYATAFSNDGAVLGIEVMDYRETYGDQIRNAAWRAQFVGKKAADPLAIDAPIRNIAGATLSCVHVTDGVRRLLATRAIIMGA